MRLFSWLADVPMTFLVEPVLSKAGCEGSWTHGPISGCLRTLKPCPGITEERTAQKDTERLGERSKDVTFSRQEARQ